MGDFKERKIRFVINYSYEKGQISSIQRGISINGDQNPVTNLNIVGIIIHPVDIPLVSSSTVESIYNKILETLKNPYRKFDIIIPSFNLRRGHPSFFSAGANHLITVLISLMNQ